MPLQIQYDPAKLSLLNVTNGDLFSRDNQAVALAHLEDRAGSISSNAARLPGAAGVNGAAVSLTRAVVINSIQRQLQSKGSQVTISVR